MELILSVMKRPVNKPPLKKKNDKTTAHRDHDDGNLIT